MGEVGVDSFMVLGSAESKKVKNSNNIARGIKGRFH